MTKEKNKSTPPQKPKPPKTRLIRDCPNKPTKVKKGG